MNSLYSYTTYSMGSISSHNIEIGSNIYLVDPSIMTWILNVFATYENLG